VRRPASSRVAVVVSDEEEDEVDDEEESADGGDAVPVPKCRRVEEEPPSAALGPGAFGGPGESGRGSAGAEVGCAGAYSEIEGACASIENLAAPEDRFLCLFFFLKCKNLRGPVCASAVR
jgi:hypothetical protein